MNSRTFNINKKKEVSEDNTSETDIPIGQGFGYPPQIFTDPTYTVAMAQTNWKKR